MKVTVVYIIASLLSVEVFSTEPEYQYRYETEDLISPTSNIPVRGYHMMQSRYYPYNIETSGRFGSIGNQFKYFQPHHENSFAIGDINGDAYNKGNGYFHDGEYRNDFANSGGQFYHGEIGENQNAITQQHGQGNSGFYNDYSGGRKNLGNGELYQGNKFTNKEGENSEKKKQNSYHKKGHVVKGYKNSHHKDETGEDEQHYDEAFDHGDTFKYIGNSGQFGETGENSYNGGSEDKFYRVDESVQQGHLDNREFVANLNFDQNLFGRDNFLLRNQHVTSSGLDQQSLLGNQESDKEYNHYIPFFRQR